jgi:hypothetical protein
LIHHNGLVVLCDPEPVEGESKACPELAEGDLYSLLSMNFQAHHSRASLPYPLAPAP